MMRRWLIFGLWVASVATAVAQEHNAARLVTADTSYVDVALGVAGQTGSLRDIFDAKREIGGVLGAQAQRTLGQVHTYGRFGYGYAYGQDVTWRGWIDPYETPFMLADSIPGSISLERYSMEAGVGLPVGGGWSLGLDATYDVALMAKHKDLRNRNTAMTFRISPGVYWQGGPLGLGLNLGYERSTERVEYTQISESKEAMLFDLYGLWLGHGSGYASAENRRMKLRQHVFGGFQLDLSLGGVQLHNALTANWHRGEQTEVGYNNRQYGTTHAWTWNDALSLEIGRAHRIEASATFSTMEGLRPLQRQELDPDSRIRIWVTYGDPVSCYWRRVHVEKLRYTYGTSWQVSVGIENFSFEHAYNEYPQRFNQRYHTLIPTLAVTVPLGPVTLTPMFGYARDYDTYTDVTEWQLKEPLLFQWDYWDGDAILGGLGLKWVSASGRTYVSAQYDLMASTLADADGRRHTAALTIGFIF